VSLELVTEFSDALLPKPIIVVHLTIDDSVDMAFVIMKWLDATRR
jgi:hypothetical protein